MPSPLPHNDLLSVDDILMGFEDELSPEDRLYLKLGSACNEQETRDHLEPGYTRALRKLANASNAEGRLMASWAQ